MVKLVVCVKCEPDFFFGDIPNPNSGVIGTYDLIETLIIIDQNEHEVYIYNNCTWPNFQNCSGVKNSYI